MEPKVVYVDIDNVKGPWDGKSWATAYQTVQEGLDDAEAESKKEVWVAKGTYKPTTTTDRTISIQLKSGVSLYGGFKGAETKLDQRDWTKNVTILSGNIGESDDNSNNSFHVVMGADNAIIDGFTITDGYNLPTGPPPHHLTPKIILESTGQGTGAGVLAFQCAPTVRNCIIKDNYAAKGAGMYNMCTKSWPPTGDEPTPTVINCTFINNYSQGRGGAVSNDLFTSPTFINCTFIDNTCGLGKGGAIYNDFMCSPTLISCVFARNTAMKGAGMANDGMSCPTLTNCTFTQNYAKDMYGGLYNGTGPTNSSNTPIVTNCIFWGNKAHNGPKEIGNWHECAPIVTYSDVEGGYKGEGNIDADPLFVDPEEGDYRLGPGSPCIDSGNGTIAPGTDRDGNPRYDDKGRPTGPLATASYLPKGGPIPEPSAAPTFNPPVDMGAYERQTDSKREPTQVVYVDADNAKGPWDGNSWATAFRDLQEGLADAYMRAKEVWVAEGTYKPTSTTDRKISFQLKSGMALYGGFNGTETDCGQRDWTKNVTILSGNIGESDDDSGNSYHVVIGADKATIDGFTITGGNANGDGFYKNGGGMINYNNSSPSVANCTFTGNYAVEGGGMYNYNLSAPTVANCTFKGNAAGKGGAMVNRVGSSPEVIGCNFAENSAKWRGGAMLIDYGSGPKITGCTFTENSSGGHGGGAFLESVAAQLGVVSTHFDKCTFNGNSAELRGGGIASTDGGNPLVTNCTFDKNYAGKGGGGMSNDFRVITTVIDCTFKENSVGEGEVDIDNDESSRVESSKK